MSDETIGLRFKVNGEDEARIALRRFNEEMAGGAEKLKQFQKNAYESSVQSMHFSQQLWTHPIKTLNTFSASAEKGKIALQYFREQLAFVAASRFGTIMLWGSVIAGVTTAVKFAVSSFADLEVAVRHVESAFIGSEKRLREFGEIQDTITQGAIRYGHSFKDVSTILWELKSAGLNATDAMAGLDTNQKLVVAGVSNIEQSTRLTSAIFRAYGDTLEGAKTSTEKFAQIGDTLAYVLNKSQADMDGLVQSFKYVLSTGQLAGFTFNQLASYIAVLNNKMLFGSTAGTSLSNSFIQLAKHYKEIAKEFNIKINPDLSIGEQFDSFIKQMSERFKNTKMSLEELSELFDKFNNRGGRAIAGIILGSKEWVEIQGELEKRSKGVQGSLDAIANTKMDTLSAQFKRFIEGTSSAMANSFLGTFLKNMFKSGADSLEGADEATLERFGRSVKKREKLLSNFKWESSTPPVPPIVSPASMDEILSRADDLNALYQVGFVKLDTVKTLLELRISDAWNKISEKIIKGNSNIDDEVKVLQKVESQLTHVEQAHAKVEGNAKKITDYWLKVPELAIQAAGALGGINSQLAQALSQQGRGREAMSEIDRAYYAAKDAYYLARTPEQKLQALDAQIAAQKQISSLSDISERQRQEAMNTEIDLLKQKQRIQEDVFYKREKDAKDLVREFKDQNMDVVADKAVLKLQEMPLAIERAGDSLKGNLLAGMRDLVEYLERADSLFKGIAVKTSGAGKILIDGQPASKWMNQQPLTGDVLDNASLRSY